MFKCKCPWCGEKTYLAHFGRKLSKVPPKWYETTRYVLVCPYCNGIVKQNPKHLLWILLFLPLFALLFFDIVIEMKPWNVTELHWGLLALGALGAYIVVFTAKLEKSSDP